MIIYLCKTCGHFMSDHNDLQGCTIHEYCDYCPCQKFIPDKPPTDKQKEKYMQAHRWDLCMCGHSLNVHDELAYCTGYAVSDLKAPKRCECKEFKLTDKTSLVDPTMWYRAEQDLNPFDRVTNSEDIEQEKEGVQSKVCAKCLHPEIIHYTYNNENENYAHCSILGCSCEEFKGNNNITVATTPLNDRIEPFKKVEPMYATHTFRLTKEEAQEFKKLFHLADNDTIEYLKKKQKEFLDSDDKKEDIDLKDEDWEKIKRALEGPPQKIRTIKQIRLDSWIEDLENMDDFHIFKQGVIKILKELNR